MLKQISCDFYNISNRLKLVDLAYNVFYNTSLKVFQVYELKGNREKVFLFNIGKNLNALAIRKAYETSFRNFKNIFKNMEKTNLKIEQKNKEHLLDFSKSMLKPYLEYADKKGTDVNFDKANLFKWI